MLRQNMVRCTVDYARSTEDRAIQSSKTIRTLSLGRHRLLSSVCLLLAQEKGRHQCM